MEPENIYQLKLSVIKMKTFLIIPYLCIVALINLLLFIAKKECIKLHHKAFRADYILRSTKLRALGAARILVLREFKYK